MTELVGLGGIMLKIAIFRVDGTLNQCLYQSLTEAAQEFEWVDRWHRSVLDEGGTHQPVGFTRFVQILAGMVGGEWAQQVQAKSPASLLLQPNFFAWLHPHARQSVWFQYTPVAAEDGRSILAIVLPDNFAEVLGFGWEVRTVSDDVPMDTAFMQWMRGDS